MILIPGLDKQEEGGNAKWLEKVYTQILTLERKKGISRPKSKSTISKKAYKNMKAGFPKKKSKK